MFYVYIGDLKAIHKEIEKVSKENNMEIKYSKDITKEQFYGFFYKPSVYYFLYNKEQFTDNKYIDAFIARSVKSDSIIICVVDDDIDIFDPNDVEYAIATRVKADDDVIIIPKARGSSLDPVSEADGTTTKMGIDATKSFRNLKDYERVSQTLEK